MSISRLRASVRRTSSEQKARSRGTRSNRVRCARPIFQHSTRLKSVDACMHACMLSHRCTSESKDGARAASCTGLLVCLLHARSRIIS